MIQFYPESCIDATNHKLDACVRSENWDGDINII